jgi:hypothetical protein
MNVMNWLPDLGRRLLMLLRRRQFDADLNEEMRLHRDLRAQGTRARHLRTPGKLIGRS